jgi:hypothetical protein
MSAFLKPESYGKLTKLLEGEREKALEARDFDYVAELNKVGALLETGGGIIKKPSAYVAYVSDCMVRQAKGGTQAQTRLNFRTCALKWKEMPDAEKKRWEKPGLEVVNLP